MFSFKTIDRDNWRLSVSDVMMIKEGKTVLIVNPRSKAILRLTRKSFLSFLDLDGRKESEVQEMPQKSFQDFYTALRQGGLIEHHPPSGTAYDVSRIRAYFDTLQGVQDRAILNPPGLITVNINERCKFNCPHCYMNSNRNNVDEMETDVIVKEIILPLAKIGGRNIMWSGGDPVLTREKTVYCTKIAASLGISVATQAAEYSEDFLREFAAAGGNGIQFSMYSSPSHPEVDDHFRGRAGSWQMTLKNIYGAKENGLSVFINMILFPGNVDEFEETADFVYELGVDTFRVTIPVITGRAAENSRVLNFETGQLKDLTKRSLAMRERYASRMRVLTDISELGNPFPIRYSFCNAGMTYMHVAGYKVFPCNFMLDDAFCLGNIKDQPLDQIWRNSPKLRDFRVAEPINQKCIECPTRLSYEEKCTDCKAVMWMRFKSFLNPETVPCNRK